MRTRTLSKAAACAALAACAAAAHSLATPHATEKLADVVDDLVRRAA